VKKPPLSNVTQRHFLELILSENRAHLVDTAPAPTDDDAFDEITEAFSVADKSFWEESNPAARVVQLAILGAAVMRLAERLHAQCTPAEIESLQSEEVTK
jgi:hypothetical protein